jgi:hypothetical protein
MLARLLVVTQSQVVLFKHQGQLMLPPLFLYSITVDDDWLSQMSYCLEPWISDSFRPFFVRVAESDQSRIYVLALMSWCSHHRGWR